MPQLLRYGPRVFADRSERPACLFLYLRAVSKRAKEDVNTPPRLNPPGPSRGPVSRGRSRGMGGCACGCVTLPAAGSILVDPPFPCLQPATGGNATTSMGESIALSSTPGTLQTVVAVSGVTGASTAPGHDADDVQCRMGGTAALVYLVVPPPLDLSPPWFSLRRVATNGRQWPCQRGRGAHETEAGLPHLVKNQGERRVEVIPRCFSNQPQCLPASFLVAAAES